MQPLLQIFFKRSEADRRYLYLQGSIHNKSKGETAKKNKGRGSQNLCLQKIRTAARGPVCENGEIKRVIKNLRQGGAIFAHKIK